MNSRAELTHQSLLFVATLAIGITLILSAGISAQSSVVWMEWSPSEITSEKGAEDSIRLIHAELLNANRKPVQNIFEELGTMDSTWSPEVPSGEFVRVTFETELDARSFIRVYMRTTAGSPRVLVHEENGETPIAELARIREYAYNKIPLRDLKGRQKTFDLQILDGSVEINHVIDPPAQLTDDSYTLGAGTIDELATTTVTIPYTNSKDPGTWEQVELTETGVDTTLNALTLSCAGDNTGFKVNSIDVSGCATCTDNGDGTIQVTGQPSAASVVWTIEACSSANSDSPYTMRHQCTGCTNNVNFNANAVLTVNAFTPDTTISIPTNTVNFGSMNLGDTNDTTDDLPAPFQVQNDGNVNVNITILAEDMWTVTANPTANYRFAAANTSETVSFDWDSSTTTLTNMPDNSTATNFLNELKSADATDTAEVDIDVTVPGEEPPATRNSIVTVTASQS